MFTFVCVFYCMVVFSASVLNYFRVTPYPKFLHTPYFKFICTSVCMLVGGFRSLVLIYVFCSHTNIWYIQIYQCNSIINKITLSIIHTNILFLSY